MGGLVLPRIVLVDYSSAWVKCWSSDELDPWPTNRTSVEILAPVFLVRHCRLGAKHMENGRISTALAAGMARENCTILFQNGWIAW